MALLLDREHFRSAVLRYVELPGARFFSRLGLTPNSITLLGFAISAAAAIVVGAGFTLAAGIVFFLGGVLDLFDGALARLTGRTTKFGALLDSVMDRLGEAALFLGITVYAVREDLSEDRTLFIVVALLLALITSQTVSYLRARGESLGIDTRAGLMTRPERVVLLSFGLIIGLRALEVILIVIAVVSFITLLQRLFTIWGQVSEDPSAPAGVDKKGDTM